MSSGTKYLQRVLQNAQRGIDSYEDALIGAAGELEAIHEAARYFTENRAKNRLAEYVAGGKDWAKACALMEQIAKEAP